MREPLLLLFLRFTLLFALALVLARLTSLLPLISSARLEQTAYTVAVFLRVVLISSFFFFLDPGHPRLPLGLGVTEATLFRTGCAGLPNRS